METLTDKEILAKKDAEIERLKSQLSLVLSELEYLKRMVFGRKSERFVPEPVAVNQLNLFTQADDLEDSVPDDEPVRETISYVRNKPKARQHPGRTPIPAHFPEEIHVVEPEEYTEGMVRIGEDRSEYVEFVPAQFVKHVIIRPKYARPEENGTTRVIIGKLPSRPIPKSIAGASLLAYIVVNKFVDHQPFYRQIKKFWREEKWKLHKSTINSWFVAVCTLIEPLYNLLVSRTLDAEYLQADESKIKVLTKTPRDKDGNPSVPKETKGSKQMLGWMWIVHNPIDKLVFFNYENNRAEKGANATLRNFDNGYLQTDALSSYNKIGKREGIHHLGCLAHARRKYFEAQGSDLTRAEYALDLIQKIYKKERLARDMTPEDRLQWREAHVRPLYTKFKYWVDEECVRVTPKSPMGKAMTYTQNQWKNLMRVFEDGRLLLDNNQIENKVRPLALGRKNYLFAGSHEGAQRIAMMYSLLATCAVHGINPLEWLTDTLRRIADTKMTDLHQLLPTAEWRPAKDQLTA